MTMSLSICFIVFGNEALNDDLLPIEKKTPINHPIPFYVALEGTSTVND